MDARVGSKEDPVQKVRGIIFHPEGLLLMRRVRRTPSGGQVQYHVLPGGGREIGETLEQCLKREIKEEAGVQVKVEGEFMRIRFPAKEEIFFICRYTGGRVGSGDGPEFTPARIQQRGLYIAEVVPMKDIPRLDLKPIEVKAKLIKDYGL